MHRNAENPGSDQQKSLRQNLKLLAHASLYFSGAASIYGNAASKDQAVALMYHSVAQPQDARFIAPRNRMDPCHFETQMRFLAQHRNVISLDEFLTIANAGQPLPPRTVLLTLDDGYKDNLEVVAPILAKYNLPATLYLCTGYVTREENQWADVLYAAIRFRKTNSLTIEGYSQFDLGKPGQTQQAYLAGVQNLLPANYASRKRVLDKIIRQLAPDPLPQRQTLNWNEVRQIAKKYPQLTLGVHTANHIDLSNQSIAAAEMELLEASTSFETELGLPARHFSFPYSRPNQKIQQRLPELGLISAMTTTGLIDKTAGRFDPYDLRRLEAPASPWMLRYWTTGAYPGLSERIFGRA